MCCTASGEMPTPVRVAERLAAQLEQDAGKFRFFGRGHKI
jgi:hypothetical protein